MKRIIICYICKKPRQYKDSYAVKIEDFTAEPEEKLKPVKSSAGALAVNDGYKFPILKARICRVDAKRLGYKVKQK